MNANTTVIFLPGLYGSSLRCARSGALRWPSLREIVLRRRSLATPDGTLRADGVIDRVDIVPKLYSIDVYGEAVAGLRRALGAAIQWRELAYDWRREVSTQTAALDAAIEQERSRGRRVVLVAHSLGGLLACYYLRYGTQPLAQAREDWSGALKVDCVALAGVPFGGSALALVDLVDGRRVAGNGRLLDAATYRSFGATWQLLPQRAAPLLNIDAATLMLDLFDARDWQRLALVPPGTEVAPQLQSAQRLRTLLAHKTWLRPARMPRMLVVQGSERPTLDRLVHHPASSGPRLIDNLKSWRRHNAAADRSRLYEDGDGVVTRTDSAAPAVWSDVADLQTLVVPRSHRRLFNDRAVQAQVAALLREPEAAAAA